MQAALSPTPFGDGLYLCWAARVESQVCEGQQNGLGFARVPGLERLHHHQVDIGPLLG